MTSAAEVMPSLAMEPGVRTIPGYQSFCRLHWFDGDSYAINGVFEDGIWMGQWRENWIDARLDAVLHNLAVHPAATYVPATPWWEF